MCLVHGLVTGDLLRDDEGLIVRPDLACTCAGTGDGVSRRQLLTAGMTAGAGALAASAFGLTPSAPAHPAPPAQAAATRGTRVVALGVQGGPAMGEDHKQPATALVVDDRIYLVDAGADVISQLIAAQLSLVNVRHLFLTHFHSDHVAGYPAVGILGWQQPPAGMDRLDVWGPPPMTSMHNAFTTLFETDIRARQLTGSRPLAQRLFAHEVDLPASGITTVLEDDKVVVSAVRVPHGADMPHAYAYRFDIRRTGRSVVFSGDCSPSDGFVALARGADLMIHEAVSKPGVRTLMQLVVPAFRTALRDHLLGSHTDVELVPSIAKAAGVKRVALHHYVPPISPIESFERAARRAAGRTRFRGEVLALRDLQTLRL
jgi:ribonuclease BN (tRNA processing enzyme)